MKKILLSTLLLLSCIGCVRAGNSNGTIIINDQYPKGVLPHQAPVMEVEEFMGSRLLARIYGFCKACGGPSIVDLMDCIDPLYGADHVRKSFPECVEDAQDTYGI